MKCALSVRWATSPNHAYSHFLICFGDLSHMNILFTIKVKSKCFYNPPILMGPEEGCHLIFMVVSPMTIWLPSRTGSSWSLESSGVYERFPYHWNLHEYLRGGMFSITFKNLWPWIVLECVEHGTWLVLNYLEMSFLLFLFWDCIFEAIRFQSTWIFWIACYAQGSHTPLEILVYWAQIYVLQVVSFCKNLGISCCKK